MNSLEVSNAAAAEVSVAPRVTLDDIENRIADVTYFQHGLLTICVLTLENGYTVTGESACADPANYNEELGKRFAREQAVRKVWPLEGYLLRQRLYEAAR